MSVRALLTTGTEAREARSLSHFGLGNDVVMWWPWVLAIQLHNAEYLCLRPFHRMYVQEDMQCIEHQSTLTTAEVLGGFATVTVNNG